MGTPHGDLEALTAAVDKAIRLNYPLGFPNGREEQRGFFGDVSIQVHYERNQIHSVKVNGRRFIKKELVDKSGS